jgi:hypothetical protein
MKIFNICHYDLLALGTWRAKELAIASASKKCALYGRPTAAHVLDAPWEARSFT